MVRAGYNVYKVTFLPRRQRVAEMIAVVPSQNQYQGTGTIYHVFGNVGSGMHRGRHRDANFSRSERFKSSIFQFYFPEEELWLFEAIVNLHEAPHDPWVLPMAHLDRSIPYAKEWVENVLEYATEYLSVQY
ncbi:hypothetical protein BDV25DRAFT_140837 [Aspergillus avenaceus]|uniref:Uncharacterized protein n=1 Tax=Aspergillus avenaceus TaxID=36643 RepID=A0A5N6TSV8_ASPAV|nr:hypothetical protein BDV25DRAFT_140837 [Aspergillus avenaceus]